MSKPYLTLFGERCSGTRWAETCLRTYFSQYEFGYKYGWKHWWDKSGTWVHENVALNDDHVMGAIVVRNVWGWLNSIWGMSTPGSMLYYESFSGAQPMNAHPMTIQSAAIGDFSIVTLDGTGTLDGPNDGLLGLRYHKLSEMLQNTDFEILRYEDLAFSVEETMQDFAKRSGLHIQKGKLPAGDGDASQLYAVKKPFRYDDFVSKYGEDVALDICQYVDWGVEEGCGYTKPLTFEPR